MQLKVQKSFQSAYEIFQNTSDMESCKFIFNQNQGNIYDHVYCVIA